MWYSRGVRIVIYLGGGIGSAVGRAIGDIACIFVQDNLDKAGSVTHVEKSHWEPSSTAGWLGFLLHLEKGCVIILPETIATLKIQ